MKGTGRRVLVAMSGGGDSSAAVYLLREQGYDCVTAGGRPPTPAWTATAF